jgi:hypothetical protein
VWCRIKAPEDHEAETEQPLFDLHHPTIEISFVRSFRASVYTGLMPARPSVCVRKKESDVYEVEVTAGQPTLHRITAGVRDVECLTGGKANAEPPDRRKLSLFARTRVEQFDPPLVPHHRHQPLFFPNYESEIRLCLAR